MTTMAPMGWAAVGTIDGDRAFGARFSALPLARHNVTFPSSLVWSCSLFGWLVAHGWCWFVLREEYCWLVAAGCWWLVRSERKVLLAGD
jgi:hypothetical protein